MGRAIPSERGQVPKEWLEHYRGRGDESASQPHCTTRPRGQGMAQIQRDKRRRPQILSQEIRLLATCSFGPKWHG